jgi:sugar (pentulose or hexulose) kinase
MALPAFALGGPFAGNAGTLENAASLTDSERAALATMYVALMTDLLIDILGGPPPTIYLDGPLARSRLFGSILSALRADAAVFANEDGAGPSRALCFLGGFPETPASNKIRAVPLPLPRIGLCRKDWRERLTDPT